MGWFGSDEIENNFNTSAHDTLQTVALSVIALVVLIYGILRIVNNHQKRQAERVANLAVRLNKV